MNISELLFAVKEEVRCCRDGSGTKYFVGDTFFEYRSSARPKTAAARTNKSKLNAVALLMDAMLVDKKIFIGQSTRASTATLSITIMKLFLQLYVTAIKLYGLIAIFPATERQDLLLCLRLRSELTTETITRINILKAL